MDKGVKNYITQFTKDGAAEQILDDESESYDGMLLERTRSQVDIAVSDNNSNNIKHKLALTVDRDTMRSNHLLQHASQAESGTLSNASRVRVLLFYHQFEIFVFQYCFRCRWHWRKSRGR
jgi:hypothetical protein